VILQRPFKHAFRLEFNKYTIDIITSQLQGEREVKMDKKMSILKPRICGWLFTAWHHLTIKLDMVKKGWKHNDFYELLKLTFKKKQ
jgi:hypothetical protein